MQTAKFAPEQTNEESSYAQPVILEKAKQAGKETSIASEGYLVVRNIKPDPTSSTEPTTPLALSTGEDLTKSIEDLPEPVLRLPTRFNPDHRFKILQKWEGMVVEISEDECRAVLHDLTSPDSPTEEVTFSVEEISESDRALALPGAVFYWSIGYDDTIQGQRSRKSVIRFRRLPAWTQREFEAAQREAQSLKDLLGWE